MTIHAALTARSAQRNQGSHHTAALCGIAYLFIIRPWTRPTLCRGFDGGIVVSAASLIDLWYVTLTTKE